MTFGNKRKVKNHWSNLDDWSSHFFFTNRAWRTLKNSFKRFGPFVYITESDTQEARKAGRAVTLIWKKQRSWKIASRETRWRDIFLRTLCSSLLTNHAGEEGKKFYYRAGYLTRYSTSSRSFAPTLPIDFPFNHPHTISRIRL